MDSLAIWMAFSSLVTTTSAKGSELASGIVAGVTLGAGLGASDGIGVGVTVGVGLGDTPQGSWNSSMAHDAG